MDNFAIRTLQNYGVKITIDRALDENRGYAFTPYSIAGSPEECALFQLAINLMVIALEHNPSLIRPFLKKVKINTTFDYITLLYLCI